MLWLAWMPPAVMLNDPPAEGVAGPVDRHAMGDHGAADGHALPVPARLAAVSLFCQATNELQFGATANPSSRSAVPSGGGDGAALVTAPVMELMSL